MRSEALERAFGAPPLDVDPASALQLVLDRAVSTLLFAMDKADNVPAEKFTEMTAFGPFMNEWCALERELRKEVGYLAAKMVDIGIADRAVQIEEAKAVLLLRAIEKACEAAGIPRDQVRKLGPAIREQLVSIDAEVVAA